MILYSRFLGQGLYQPGIVTVTVEDLHELSQRVLAAQTLVEYAQEGIIDFAVLNSDESGEIELEDEVHSFSTPLPLTHVVMEDEEEDKFRPEHREAMVPLRRPTTATGRQGRAGHHSAGV